MTRDELDKMGDELATQISLFVNYGGDAIKLGRELALDHRTLQQRKMVIILAFIDEVVQRGSDLRNEETFNLCKQFRELANKWYFESYQTGEVRPGLPFI